MDSSFIALINFIKHQTVIYIAIPGFILGVIGGCLNIIIFLSLKTFRQSSCAFHLMIMSAFDIARCFSSVLPYIMRRGFDIDWGISSLFFCKIRLGLFTTCTLCSMTCLCLAIINQYFATSIHVRWQQWCNIKLAHRLTSIFIIIWILHGIPMIIFSNQIILPISNLTTCQITNVIFNQYWTYGYNIILENLVPLITFVFGLMAYYNARHITRRIVPLIRRELDKQLTVMVLIQVLISFCTLIPFSLNNIFAAIIEYQIDPIFIAKRSLASVIITDFFIISISSPFYTYLCVSKRFRRQLKYVLFEIHVKRCRANKIDPYNDPQDVITNIEL